MTRLFRIGALAGILCSAASGAHAAVNTYSYQPNPANLYNLDHHTLYTWKIDDIDPSNQPITGATITINCIYNWNSNPNILYMHLLDTAKNDGVASFVHDPNGATDVPPSKWVDDFVNTRFHDRSDWLVAPGTADTFLTSPSFTDKATNYTYTFTADQLKALNAYVANGHDIALGFDPNCHFFNSGVTFTITTAPVPEPSAIALMGIGLAGLAVRHRVARRKAGAAPAA